jgi:hypothetical protein
MELKTMTGTDLNDADLEAIISLADKEVDAYLAQYGLSGSASEKAVNVASLKLSTIILYQRCHTPEHDSAIGALTKTAYALLDEHIRKQTSLPNSKRPYCRKVN